MNSSIVGRDLNLGFSKIQLVDSTSFKIPDDLSTFYKGYQGKGEAASLKIHFNYNFLNGGIVDICLTDGSFQ